MRTVPLASDPPEIKLMQKDGKRYQTLLIIIFDNLCEATTINTLRQTRYKISRARPSHSLSPIFVQVEAFDSVSVTSAELSLAAQLDPGESLA